MPLARLASTISVENATYLRSFGINLGYSGQQESLSSHLPNPIFTYLNDCWNAFAIA